MPVATADPAGIHREPCVARVGPQRFFVDVQNGVHPGVALDVTRHLPAQREVRADDLGQLLAGVVGVATRSWRHPDGSSGVGVQIRERQVDVADPRRPVDPDLDADLPHHVVAVGRRLRGGHLRGGHLVDAKTDR